MCLTISSTSLHFLHFRVAIWCPFYVDAPKKISFKTYYHKQVLPVYILRAYFYVDHEGPRSILKAMLSRSVLSQCLWCLFRTHHEWQTLKPYCMQCHMSIQAWWVHPRLLSWHNDWLPHPLPRKHNGVTLLFSASIFKEERRELKVWWTGQTREDKFNINQVADEMKAM